MNNELKLNSKQRILKALKDISDRWKNIIPGKNPDRVHKHYEKYPSEWHAQYNMLLMDGKTCDDCMHCIRCVTLFDQKETSTTCQFYPSRVVYKKEGLTNE